jgi:hypothetical protein
MYSKILVRFEEIVRFTSEDITRALESTLVNTVELTEISVFYDMLARHNKLRAYLYVTQYFRERLKSNCRGDTMSLADAVNLTHEQVYNLVTNEIVAQSSNVKLSVHYKMALIDMSHALRYVVPQRCPA